MSEAAHLALRKHRVYHILRRGVMEIKVTAQFLDIRVLPKLPTTKPWYFWQANSFLLFPLLYLL